MNDIYPKPIAELAAALRTLPGIGARTAERLALAMLDWDETLLRQVGELIGSLRSRVGRCGTCGNLSETEVCAICTDPRRDQRLVCVVESPRQIPPILKSDRFYGVFHVLGGHLNPLDDVGVEELNIAALYRRIREQDVQEVILATSPNVEGEATAVYLAGELEKQFATIKVTRIARGVPLGSDLTFADAATMAMAIDSRRSFHR